MGLSPQCFLVWSRLTHSMRTCILFPDSTHGSHTWAAPSFHRPLSTLLRLTVCSQGSFFRSFLQGPSLTQIHQEEQSLSPKVVDLVRVKGHWCGKIETSSKCLLRVWLITKKSVLVIVGYSCMFNCARECCWDNPSLTGGPESLRDKLT